jgi:hypothetical protein
MRSAKKGGFYEKDFPERYNMKAPRGILRSPWDLSYFTFPKLKIFELP